jgi:hypothetical protein
MIVDPGRGPSKAATTVAGTNVTNSSTQSFKRVDIMSTPSATSNNLKYRGEDDSQKVVSSVGGDGSAGAGAESIPARWGYNAASGSRVEIFDGAGNERIDIVHASGAGVTVEPDGAIFISSKSSRGAGLTAPLGDVMITASGDIIIKGGAGLTIHTAGDLNMDVGGTFTLSCDNFDLNTNNYNAVIDGPSTTAVTNDSSVVIGGIDRKTVAGDQREQTTGKRIIDVGSDYTHRVSGNQSVDVQGTSTHTIKGDHTLQTAGKTKITSDSDASIDTGGALSIKTKGATDINGNEAVEIKAEGNLKMSTKSTAEYASDGNMSVSSRGSVAVNGRDGAKLESQGSVDVASGSSVKVVGSQTEISGGTVHVKAGTLLSADKTGDAGAPDTATVPAPAAAPAPASPESAAAAKDAQVMEAKDVVDTLTSARKYPEYAGNGVRESANATGLGMIEGDEIAQAEGVMKDYSGGNSGNMNPSQEVEVYDTLPDTPVNRPEGLTAVEPDKAIPSYGNMSAQISKYFTMGKIINGTASRNKPPPGKWEELAKMAILLANNVLDPIVEKYPDLLVTSWYRTNSKNHVSGRAIDIVVDGREMAKHADIARFARDSLPVDQVFLEKNDSGRTHVHLRVSMPGSKDKPRVMTCGDKRCRSKVQGIQVAWLGRRAR